MVKITYITYTCPSCKRRPTMVGTQPLHCPVCNSVICWDCSPRGICPVCKTLIAPEEEGYMAGMEQAGYSWSGGNPIVTGKGLGTGCAACMLIVGLLVLFIGVMVLMTPTGAKVTAIFMAIVGAAVTIIGLAMYIPKTKKNKQFLTPMKDYWKKLISTLQQRRAQAIGGARNPPGA